ncbi:hypothetical protein N825_03415 [Skermanella stibiiresistens SB22]|uniref:Uncharacterized protein n=1 Tax=Skermanella stibiiresistens SB22 TaxID=1385369 RepID=W9H5T9_9PROT|nr:hypothetical protein N825_03415 [Skermanella stibiiresistens SB22]
MAGAPRGFREVVTGGDETGESLVRGRQGAWERVSWFRGWECVCFWHDGMISSESE